MLLRAAIYVVATAIGDVVAAKYKCSSSTVGGDGIAATHIVVAALYIVL